MVEKVIVNPVEVRGLGNVVSPKSLSDFDVSDGTVSSASDSTYGTVYSLGYRTGSYMVYEGSKWITPSSSTFDVSVTLKAHSDGSAITSSTVSCLINESTTLSATTDSNGVATFSIPVAEGICDYKLLFKYAGTDSIAGCFASVLIHTGSDEWNFDSSLTKSIIQVGETSEVITTVTGTDCNGESRGVMGVPVYFFEEWTPNARLSGTPIIQSGDTDTLTAQLIDNSDGNIVKESGHTIYFYQEKTNGKLIDNPSEIAQVGSGILNIAEVEGLPSHWKLSVQFKTVCESRLFIGDKDSVNGNPNYSLFVGSPNGSNKANYGDRDTSTHATNLSSYGITDYTPMSIEKNGDTITYTLNGTSYTKTVSWFDDYDGFVIGLANWGSSSDSVCVKDLVFEVFEEE